jgi:hypothetical protein
MCLNAFDNYRTDTEGDQQHGHMRMSAMGENLCGTCALVSEGRRINLTDTAREIGPQICSGHRTVDDQRD